MLGTSRDRLCWTKQKRDGHSEVVELLLDHGARADAQMNDYWTAP